MQHQTEKYINEKGNPFSTSKILILAIVPALHKMSFYFQPPIFGDYLLPAAPATIPSSLVVLLPRTTYTPLYWQPAPVITPVPQYILTSHIKIKIIFHRAGIVLASNDAYYNYTPTRETVLANLAWWSKQHNLGDRVYSGQCTLYTTRSQYSNLSILPDVGPITPADNVRKVSFADQLTANDFQSIMYQISANSYGAFILVDVSMRRRKISWWKRKR